METPKQAATPRRSVLGSVEVEDDFSAVCFACPDEKETVLVVNNEGRPSKRADQGKLASHDIAPPGTLLGGD